MTAAQHVAEAIREAEAALSALSRFQPTHKAPEPGAPGCASCRRIGTFSPQLEGGGGNCDWCYRWKLANGTPPPLGVLDARSQGRRITTRVVDEATRAERRTRKPKRRKAS